MLCYIFSDTNFKIGAAFVKNDYSIFQDDSYFTVDFNQGFMNRSKNQEITEYSSLETEYCGDYFSKVYKYLYPNLANNQISCIKNNNFTLSGSFFTKSYKYVEINMYLCYGKPTCKDINTILNTLAGGRISLIVESSYADLSDYNQPIKTNYKDSLTFRAEPQWTKEIRVFIKKNKLVLQNSFIGYGSTTKNFYSLSSILTDAGLHEGMYNKIPIIKIRFAIDSSEDTFERDSFTIFNLISQVGGFYGMFSVCVAVFVKLFSNNLFYFSVISKIYQVNCFDEDEPEQLNINNMFQSNVKTSSSPNQVKPKRTKHLFEESKYHYNPEMHKELNESQIEDIMNLQHK